MKRWISPLLLLLCLGIATPALAGQVNMKKLKKWPETDKVLARSFDVWMTDDEVAVFSKLGTTEERKQFLEQAGYWQMWENIDEEMLPHVMEGKVVKGMTQDEVYMCWDKPVKIRKDFKKEAYVDILYYTFEVDRKGNEFLLVEGSPTAYKNDELTYYVYMDNGKVFAVVESSQAGGVLDDLIEEKQRAEEARNAAKPVVEGDDAPQWTDDSPKPTEEPARKDAEDGADEAYEDDEGSLE
jgi:hypothetical protein